MLEETRNFWNRVADDWLIQVGDDGDSNRLLNSDPVLWKFAGDVSGLAVLDAGCGTGHLSKQLRDRGALVAGIDFSERMIEIARAQHPDIDFRVDSCSELRTIADESFDMVIANGITTCGVGFMRARVKPFRFSPCLNVKASHWPRAALQPF